VVVAVNSKQDEEEARAKKMQQKGRRVGLALLLALLLI
jgi:hypothetical protein